MCNSVSNDAFLDVLAYSDFNSFGNGLKQNNFISKGGGISVQCKLA